MKTRFRQISVLPATAILLLILLLSSLQCRKPPVPVLDNPNSIACRSYTLTGQYLHFFEMIVIDGVSYTAEALKAFTSPEGDRLSLVLPQGLSAEQSVSLFLMAEGGQSNTIELQVVATPSFETSPIQGVPGETLRLTGQELSGVDTICFNNLCTTNFSASETEISVVVPEGVLSGNIIPHFCGNALSSIPFTLKARPVISALSRSRVAQGDTLTIFGENFFANETTVIFREDQSVAPEDINFISSAQLQVKVPLNAQSGNLLLTTPCGEANIVIEICPPLPVVVGLTPNEFRIGETVTIHGSNFLGTDISVTFNNVTTSDDISLISGSELRVIVPAGATSGTLFLTTKSGESNRLAFQIISSEPKAKLQIIHNAADPALALIDIYYNNEKVWDDFAFRKATPISSEVPTSFELGIALGSVGGIIKKFTLDLEVNEFYILLIDGVVDQSRFDRSVYPDIGLGIKQLGPVGSVSGSDLAVIHVAHGVTDLPAVSIGGGPVDPTPAFSFDGFGFVDGSLSLEEKKYLLSFITVSEVAGTYEVDIAAQGLKGQALTGFLSGFQQPSGNQNGPGMKFLYATAEGTVREFPRFTPPAPMIASITPLKAATGCSITIRGENFNGTSTSVIFPSGVTVPVNPVDGETIQVTVPENAGSGAVRVSVNGVSASYTTFFAGIDMPLISRTLPQVGQNPGGPLIILGEGLEHISGVQFGTEPLIKAPGMEAFPEIKLLATNVSASTSLTGKTVPLKLQVSEGCFTPARNFTMGSQVAGNAPAPGAPHNVVIPFPPPGISLPSVSNNWSVGSISATGYSFDDEFLIDGFFDNCDTCDIVTIFPEEKKVGRFTADGSFVELEYNGTLYEGRQDSSFFDPANFGPFRMVLFPVNRPGGQIEMVFPSFLEKITGQTATILQMTGRYKFEFADFVYRKAGSNDQYKTLQEPPVIDGFNITLDITELSPGTYEIRADSNGGVSNPLFFTKT